MSSSRQPPIPDPDHRHEHTHPDTGPDAGPFAGPDTGSDADRLPPLEPWDPQVAADYALAVDILRGLAAFSLANTRAEADEPVPDPRREHQWRAAHARYTRALHRLRSDPTGVARAVRHWGEVARRLYAGPQP